MLTAIIGARGGNRTHMVCTTRPSNVRVYQFRHPREYSNDIQKIAYEKQKRNEKLKISVYQSWYSGHHHCAQNIALRLCMFACSHDKGLK